MMEQGLRNDDTAKPSVYAGGIYFYLLINEVKFLPLLKKYSVTYEN